MPTPTYRFPKNERGYNERSFRFLHATLIRATRFLFDPVVVNPHNMPLTGPCFIYGNHSNNFDPFVLNVPLTREPTAGVMTRDQFYKFLPALFMDSIGIVPTSKYVPDPAVIRNVIRMIQQNRMIVIFPEGGRRWDGRPKGTIESTMKLFWKMKVPVHPVQFHGSYVGWPRWATYPRRNRFRMIFLDPLVPGDFPDYDTFHAACVRAIDFHEEEPAPETLPFKVFRPADGIDKILYRCPRTGVDGAIWTPDGRRVLSKTDPDFQYEMNNASQLVDPTGLAHNISGFYDTIRELPMSTDANGLLLDEPQAKISWIDAKFRLHPLSSGRVWLHPDHVGLQHAQGIERLPIEHVLYISIEQNTRITLTMRDGTWMISLGRTRALQWQDHLQRLKQGEICEPSPVPFTTPVEPVYATSGPA